MKLVATNAPRKESAAIRAEMQQIRNELPYSLDCARDNVRELVDWKTYVRSFPSLVLPAAAVVGYLIVPSGKSEAEPSIRHPSRQGMSAGSGDASQMAPGKRSLLAGLMSGLFTIGSRAALSYASNRLSASLNRNPDESKANA